MSRWRPCVLSAFDPACSRLPLCGSYATGIAHKNSSAGARIFSFGAGHDVNTYLLDELSGQNRGVVDYVAPGEDIEIKV